MRSLPSNLVSGNVEAVLAAGLTAFLTGAGQAPNSWRVVFDSGWSSGSVVAERVRRVREMVVGQLRELVRQYIPRSPHPRPRSRGYPSTL